MADFEIIPFPMLEVRFMEGWERGPLLGKGIRGSVRLGRLEIGMISKSAKKDGTLIVHQCPIRSLKIIKNYLNIFSGRSPMNDERVRGVNNFCIFLSFVSFTILPYGLSLSLFTHFLQKIISF
jgi:hypothetical protein